MLIPIAAGAAALLGGLFTYAGTRPGTFRVQRSTLIQAPPEAIAPHITDFRRWAAWSPYEKLDPAMKRTFAGAERGVGAVYTWEGRKAGAGRMEIREASPRRVAIQLYFSRPFTAHNTAEFTLEPEGAATRVTWAMYGAAPFAMKLMGIFLDVDDLSGKDFVTGLANLKTLAEAPAAETTR
ncbi:MAG TPA: SRPBCC family protein [Longimicrobium sp.]|nr:SRPBCC family protein [Longimicrobium sp.]